MSNFVSRAKLQAIARACSDHRTVDVIDRLTARGRVTKAAVKRIAAACSDFCATDALDALTD